MEYRLLVLALRLGLAALAAVLFGLALWFTGAVTVVQLVPGNAVAVTMNLVLGVGTGAGLAGWLFGLRLGSAHLPHMAELPAALALAIIGAWLGQVFLDDLLYRNLDAIRVKSSNEIIGAVTGANIGALLVPLIAGAWRVAHRQEP